MSLLAFGILNLPHSWAVVSTEILLQFQKKGYKLQTVSTNGINAIHPLLIPTLVPPKVVQQGGVVKKLVTAPQSDLSFSYTIPPNLRKIPAKNRIHIYNYETTKMPDGWAKEMNDYADLILPSSKFSKDIFLQNGVLDEKMFVLPHGFDPAIYNPEIKPIKINGLSDEKFKFLNVAIPHWRKGHDLLLKAYIEEFRGDDSVVLILKTSKVNQNDNLKCLIDINRLIGDLKKTHDFKWPEVRLVTARLDNLSSLYNTADVIVLPTRTECFSLTVLEASACKKPVITTNYGGHLDFLNKDNSSLIDYTLVDAPPSGQYWGNAQGSKLAAPDLDSLKKAMRDVKNNKDKFQVKADLAYKNIQDYTWENVANKLIKEIEKRGWRL